jgi:hypothetical protein
MQYEILTPCQPYFPANRPFYEAHGRLNESWFNQGANDDG